MSTTLIETLAERRARLFAETDELTSAVETRDAVFTADEGTKLKTKLGEIDELDARIEDLRKVEARREASAASAVVLETEAKASGVKVGAEARTYRPDDMARGISFFRDMFMSEYRSDYEARDRLMQHMVEERSVNVLAEREQRAGNTGNYAGLTVPQYLTDLVGPLRRAGRPLADICNGHPLPPDGMTLNISRITTGSSAAAQATENSGVSSTDIDDTLLTINVRTIAGMQDLSRQAVERGTGVDALAVQDLTRAYNTELDRQLINADGTSGTHLGIRSTAGIISVAYTDGTPTAAEMWPKLWDLTQQIQSGVFLGVSHFVAHPRRFWWLVSQVGTSFPFIAVFEGANMQTVQAGSALGTGTYENGPVGRLGPVPVILDANIVTNLGAGTNEDVFLGVTASELHLWEDANAPLFIRTEQALANQLSIRFVMYGYSGFTAGRYPGAHGTIGGTGLVTPTF